MEQKINADFQSLMDNIIDVVQEEQIKLGFREETIRLYYPMESLNHLLGTELLEEELSKVLEEFFVYTKKQLGGVKHTHKQQRFCLIIPPKGAIYVHNEVKDRTFVKEFIEVITGHPSKIEDILAVFHRYSGQVICRKMDGEDFDYLVYFEDGRPDKYRYCIKFEEVHVIYHRFTELDYKSFGFAEAE